MRTTARTLQLDNKIMDCIDERKKMIKTEADGFCTHSMYITCLYVHLRKLIGHNKAMEYLMKDNTEQYLKACISKVDGLCELIDSDKNSELESMLLAKTSEYDTRYLKQKGDYDVMLIIASLNGYKFSEIEDVYTGAVKV